MAGVNDEEAKRLAEATSAAMRRDLGLSRIDNLPLADRAKRGPTWTPLGNNNPNFIPKNFRTSLIGAWGANPIDDAEAREELRSHGGRTMVTRPWDFSDKGKVLPTLPEKRAVSNPTTSPATTAIRKSPVVPHKNSSPTVADTAHTNTPRPINGQAGAVAQPDVVQDSTSELQDCIITENKSRPSAEDNPKSWDICGGKCMFSVNGQEEKRKLNVILQLHQQTAFLVLFTETNRRLLDLQTLSDPQANGFDFSVKWNNPGFDNLTLRFCYPKDAQILCKNVTRALHHIRQMKRLATEIATDSDDQAASQTDVLSSTVALTPGTGTTRTSTPTPADQKGNTVSAIPELISIDQPQAAEPTFLQESTQAMLHREFSTPKNKNNHAQKPNLLIKIEDEGAQVRDKFSSLMNTALEPLFRIVDEMSNYLHDVSEETKNQAMSGILEAVDHRWRAQNWLISDTDIALLYGAIQGMVNFKHDINSVSAGFVTHQNGNKHQSNRYSRLVYKPDFIESLRERASNLADHMRTLEFPRPSSNPGSNPDYIRKLSPTDTTATRPASLDMAAVKSFLGPGAVKKLEPTAPPSKPTVTPATVNGQSYSADPQEELDIVAETSPPVMALNPMQPVFPPATPQQAAAQQPSSPSNAPSIKIKMAPTQMSGAHSSASSSGTTTTVSTPVENRIPLSATTTLAVSGKGLRSSRWA